MKRHTDFPCSFSGLINHLRFSLWVWFLDSGLWLVGRYLESINRNLVLVTLQERNHL